MRAAVVVLGDLQRSPRIVLHARALAESGTDVDLVGFAAPGWLPIGAPPTLRVWPLLSGVRQGRPTGGHFTYLLFAIYRGVNLFRQLWSLLFFTLPRPDLILVQNPPGVPTLLVGWLAARWRSARFGIDWHNLTWAMVGLRVGPRHPLVKLVSIYERWFARRADINLFVSAAMQEALGKAWGISGVVFRDRPATLITALPEAERRVIREHLFTRLGCSDTGAALCVTATSWSADEDFQLLLDALVGYDHLIAASEHQTPTVMLITGQGPLRAAFEQRLSDTILRHVTVGTLWLEPEEYPRLLAAADLGVCLHRSASGLDLPMKVLDMFGVRLPVCALDYGPCLRELVVDGRTGRLFTRSDELAGILQGLLGGDREPLQRLRAAVTQDFQETWLAAWHRELRWLARGNETTIAVPEA